MIKFLKTYEDPIRFFCAGFFGTAMLGLLLLNASRSSFGFVNNQVAVPRHDTVAETQKKLDDAHVPYIFSLNAVRYLINGK